jgi:hypothetical protein
LKFTKLETITNEFEEFEYYNKNELNTELRKKFKDAFGIKFNLYRR